MKILLLAILLTLSGCATVPSPPAEVKVLVPVPCEIKPIDKPAMPMDSIQVSDDLFTKVKAALSEIETRKGYELKLETAVKSCQPNKE
ncbi:MAG: hypothetical protein JHC33_10755 [Ignisphaera sp.]|nr:hypothetical protein [Ignisphaera sp.]